MISVKWLTQLILLSLAGDAYEDWCCCTHTKPQHNTNASPHTYKQYYPSNNKQNRQKLTYTTVYKSRAGKLGRRGLLIYIKHDITFTDLNISTNINTHTHYRTTNPHNQTHHIFYTIFTTTRCKITSLHNIRHRY